MKTSKVVRNVQLEYIKQMWSTHQLAVIFPKLNEYISQIKIFAFPLACFVSCHYAC
jgi:hypothetical protein